MKIDPDSLYQAATSYGIAVNCSTGGAVIEVVSPVANGTLWDDGQCDALIKALADAAYAFAVAGLPEGAAFEGIYINKEVVTDSVTTMTYSHP